jgi:hypothetical protein
MVYAIEPLQCIVKKNKVSVKEKCNSEERQRVVEGVSRGKEMAGSVTKLEQQRERNPHVQSGFWRGSACETTSLETAAAREGLRRREREAVEPQSAIPDSSVQQRLSPRLNVKTIWRTEMMAFACVR